MFGHIDLMVLHAVRDALSNTYHGQWVGRGWPTAWPPRFTSDLNPLDFYLWEHLKICVHAGPVNKCPLSAATREVFTDMLLIWVFFLVLCSEFVHTFQLKK